MRIRVIDTETTGFPPEADIVEIAYHDIVDGEIVDSNSWLCKPLYPISIQAMATHHITEDMLVDCESSAQVIAKLAELPSPDYIVAHNADFDKQFYNPPNSKWICTMKVAKRLHREAPAFSNQALRYYLNLEIEKNKFSHPHRALDDAYVTAVLFLKLLSTSSIDEMIQIMSSPSLLYKVGFGKHKGKLWSEVPVDYLDWYLGQDKCDADVVYTCRHYIKEKRGR